MLIQKYSQDSADDLKKQTSFILSSSTKGLDHNLLHYPSHRHPCHNLTQTARQRVQTKSVRFNSTKEMGVRVTDGKLSICHCAVPFGWNQREMRGLQRTSKAVSEARHALQIRAKRLYCFSSDSPFVLLCLKGVGGRQNKEDGENSIKRQAERDREKERVGGFYKSRTGCLSPSASARCVDQTLVSGICLVFPDSQGNEERWPEQRGAGLLCGSFLTVSECFAFQPFPCPALSSLLQQSRCLQRAFSWEHFDSAGCEAWVK